MSNIAKNSTFPTPSPNGVGGTQGGVPKYSYDLKAYPTIDLMKGAGPSGTPGMGSDLPMANESSRKTGKIG